MDGVIVVETHLNHTLCEHEESHWSKHGWCAQFAPGQCDESIDDMNENERGRPQGGTLMVTRDDLRVDDMESVFAALETEDLVAQVIHTKRGGILTCGAPRGRGLVSEAPTWSACRGWQE